MDFKENVIEWLNGDDRITATLSQRKHIAKVERLAKKHPDLVKILHTNEDGSIVAHLPLSAMKLNIVINSMTDEQKDATRDRLKLARESNV